MTYRALSAALTLVFLIVTIVFSTSPVLFGQQVSPSEHYIPEELQARNPDVRAKLTAARSDSRSGKYDQAFDEDQQALDIAKRATFSGDIALAEDTLASAEFISGRVQVGWDLNRDALQKAIESSNLVLQADILTSLSAYSQSAGNSKGALSLLAQALDAAGRSKSLYIKSRVLGEMGRLQLLMGEKEEAKNSLDEALRIDSLNNYPFHSLHLVYQAYLLLSDDHTVKEGIQELEKARDVAVSDQNYIALVSAETALGFSYVYTGDVQRGISILQSMNSGDIKVESGTQETQVEFRAVLELPYIRASLLEALGNAYETVKRTSDAIGAWSQLYSFSNGVHMIAANAEAAQHLANLYATQADNENAAKYYHIAAAQWQVSGNDAMLLQSLGGEAISLAKAGRSVEALAAENELAQRAMQLKNRRAEFLAYLAMAEMYPASQSEQAKTALEKAQTLIEPGPGDPMLGNEAVTETYLRLSALYEKSGDQERQLAMLEKALAVYIAAKDQARINALVATLRQKFDAIHVEDLISNLYKSQKLLDALTYSQLLYSFQGAPAGTTPAGKGPLYWHLVLNVPFQLVVQDGGDEELEQDLRLMGSILGFEKLPVLDALSWHYVSSGKDLGAARRYAAEALSLVEHSKLPLEPLRLRPVCTLAVTYARTNDANLANQTVRDCLDLAKKSSDLQDKIFANTANVLVRAYGNDIANAKESLAFLKQNVATSPSLDEEMALALGNGGQVPDAMTEFAIALKGFQDRTDIPSTARCYAEMAAVLRVSDSNDLKQLEFLTDAAVLYKRLGDVRSEVAVDVATGQYFARIEKKSEAKHYFQQGLELSEKSGNDLTKGFVSLNFGNFYFTNHELAKAFDLHQEALAAYRAAGNQVEQAFVLSDLGQDMEAMGRLDEALVSYSKAQSIAAQSGLPSSGYFPWVRIGWLYERKGLFEQARAAFRSAEQITQDADDLGDLAWSHLTLGELDALEGDSQDALEEFTKGQAIFQQIGNKDGESSADAELAAIYSDRSSSIKDFEMARKYLTLAQKLHYDKLRELDGLEIDIQAKEYSHAVGIAKEALAACQETDSNCMGHGLVSLAEAERLSGDLRASSASLKRAKPLVTKDRDVYLRGRFLYGEANQERAAGHFGAAVTFYERTIELIENAKGNIDPQLQLSMSDTYDYVYDELIDCLYSLSKQQTGTEKIKTAEKALTYAETNKARQFDKSWGQAFISGFRRKLPPDILQQEDTLVARRNQIAAESLSSVSSTDSSSGTVSNLQEQLTAAESDLHGFAQMLRSKYAAYASLKYPEPIAIDGIPLHAGETLVEFKVTDTATFVWIIRSDSGKTNNLISFYNVPEGREWLYDEISKLRDPFNSGQPAGYDPQVSEQLFGSLFPGNHAKEILDSHRLIFVPDDIVSLIPFEMLSPDASEDKYSLLSVPTRYFPSAESLRIARIASHSATWKDAFLGVGDPITSPDDPRYALVEALAHGESGPHQNLATPRNATSQVASLRARGFEFDPLPGTATEIHSIAGLFSDRHEDTDVLLGMDATRKDVLDLDLSRFRYIHFATHGILPVNAGIREPSLVLSYDGSTADNMLLPVSTILGLNIDADDVVLSACNTGSGKVSRAEGVMSLGRAFMSAGASSVTVSLWEVSDTSTALLMKEYYRNLLLGKPKDEALADARTWLFMNGYKEPYNWAPFVLIGE